MLRSLLRPRLNQFKSIGLAAIALAFMWNSSSAEILSSSVGSTSRAEATVLWKDGVTDFNLGELTSAIHKLDRLVARYPGYPHYLEAHLMLGKALVGNAEFKRALKPLRAYVAAMRPNTTGGHTGRLWLGRAHLGVGNFSEALLTSEELIKAIGNKLPAKSQNDTMSEALLIKSHALIGLNQIRRASLTLVSAKKQTESASKAVRGEQAFLELKLKTKECERLPSHGNLKEDQVIHQMERRGSCLLEALLIFRRTLDSGDRAASGLAAEALNRSFDAYSTACSNPPPPHPVQPVDRNASQLEQYRKELKTMLRHECGTKFTTALDMLTGWEGGGKSLQASVYDDFDEVRRKTTELARTNANPIKP